MDASSRLDSVFYFITVPAGLVLRLITAEIYSGLRPYTETTKYLFCCLLPKIRPEMGGFFIGWVWRRGSAVIMGRGICKVCSLYVGRLLKVSGKSDTFEPCRPSRARAKSALTRCVYFIKTSSDRSLASPSLRKGLLPPPFDCKRAHGGSGRCRPFAGGRVRRVAFVHWKNINFNRPFQADPGYNSDSNPRFILHLKHESILISEYYKNRLSLDAIRVQTKAFLII